MKKKYFLKTHNLLTVLTTIITSSRRKSNSKCTYIYAATLKSITIELNDYFPKVSM